MASPLKLTNNAIGRLTAGMSAVDTTATLVSGNGALFPTLGVGEFFPATIIRASDSAREIVKVTARSTDVLTVARAQEGTSALVFIAGDRVELRLTGGTLSTEFARVEAVADAAQTAADAAQASADAAQASADAADAAADAAAAAAAAADSSAVKLTGAQTVAGVKTFSDKPIIPDGTAAQNPVSKAQLDAEASARAAAVVPATIAPTLLVAGTAIPTTSGTSIDLSLVVPSWARRLTVVLDKVSLSSTSSLLVQIGDSGGFETADYASASTGTTGAGGGVVSSVAGFIVRFNSAALVVSGHMTLTHVGGNAWVASHSAGDSGVCMVGGGSKTLSGALDRIRITTVSGTDTFDAGQVVLMWE